MRSGQSRDPPSLGHQLLKCYWSSLHKPYQPYHRHSSPGPLLDSPPTMAPSPALPPPSQHIALATVFSASPKSGRFKIKIPSFMQHPKGITFQDLLALPLPSLSLHPSCHPIPHQPCGTKFFGLQLLSLLFPTPLIFASTETLLRCAQGCPLTSSAWYWSQPGIPGSSCKTQFHYASSGPCTGQCYL